MRQRKYVFRFHGVCETICTFWFVVKTAAVDEAGAKPAIDLLDSYLIWPVINNDPEVLAKFEREFDWVETAARLRRDGGTYLITTAVWADSRNTTRLAPSDLYDKHFVFEYILKNIWL